MVHWMVVAALTLGGLPGEEAFLSAHDAWRAGDHAQALAGFQDCAGNFPDFAPFAQVYAARCEARMGRGDAARARYGSLLRAEPRGAWTDMAFLDLARMERDRKAHAEAAALYQHVLNVSPRPWWMDEIPWEAAACLLAVPGREADGYGHYRDIIETSGLIQVRLDAARLLLPSPEEADRALALLGMMRSYAYRDAGKALQASGIWLRAAESGARLDAAVLTVVTENGGAAGPAALETWPAMAEENGENPWLPAWLLHTARRAAERGHYEAALTAAELLLRHFPETRDPADALWWLANYADGQKREDEAERVYLRIAEACPDSFRADDALMRLAERRARRKDPAGALRHYAALAERFPDSRFVAQAWLRCADLALGQGEPLEARRYLGLGADAAIGDYYAGRARARLATLGVRGEADRVVDAGPTPGLLRIATGEDYPAPGIGGPRIERLRFFGRHGIEAGEFEAALVCQEKASAPDGEAWYRAAAEAGYAHTVWQHVWAGVPEAIAEPARHRLDYPLAYWTEVTAMAAEYRLDPFILLAVSRQESTFRAHIASHAGATGVMQLMPRTADWIASTQDSVGGHHAAHLGAPVNSLRLGACYLRMMLDRSGDNLVYALASYNGGPGNCDKWRRRYGGNDMERFIETITFDETRDYVKKVLGNLAAYHALYPALADRAAVSWARADKPAGDNTHVAAASVAP